MEIRQASAIHLKRFIIENWADKEPDALSGQLEFSIHESDREVVRAHVIEALIVSPDQIRTQIGECIYEIIKSDFPGRWPQIVEKIHVYLQNSNDYNSWSGAILSLCQLVRNYEYKKADERAPLDEAMSVLLPLIYQLMVNLIQVPEQTRECAMLQKHILKMYRKLIFVSILCF